MKDYFLTILCAGIAAGIAGFLFDGKQNENIARYVKFAFMLCIVCVTALPLFGFFRSPSFPDLSFPDFSEEDFSDLQEKYDDYVTEQARVSLCDTLSRRIFEKTGIMPRSVDIQFSKEQNGDKTEVTVKSVCIVTEDRSETLFSSVEEWIGIRPTVLLPEKKG